jgi:hypothetical protein
MNRNVQHLTQPVNINKNWFFDLHAEKTSKTQKTKKQTKLNLLNISKTNKKVYTLINKNQPSPIERNQKII